MKLTLPGLGALSISLLLLTGCTDDNYDLSDIDTTSQFRVNDLTVPLRLQPITLENVLEIDENDPDAAIIVDRSNPDAPFYAVKKSGSFTATPNAIAAISTDAPTIESTNQTINGDIVNFPTNLPGKTRAGEPVVHFPVKPDETTFTYDIWDVSKEIFTVSKIGLENSDKHRTRIGISLGSPQIASVANKVIFRNIRFQLPKNLQIEVPTGCTYTNGLLTVPEITADINNGYTANFSIVVTGLDFDTPIKLKESNELEKAGHFKFSEEIGIAGADLYVFPSGNITDVPTTVNFSADYTMNSMLINSYSGDIRYAVDINDITEVSLTDIPDFLAGEQTDVRLYSPRIEIEANNPVGEYNIGCRAGLSITPRRDNGGNGQTYSLQQFEIGHDNGNGPYKIEIGARFADRNTTPGVSRYLFPELSDVLAGAGIPQHLKIDLKSTTNPQPVIAGNAQNFPLGTSLNQVNGKYTFFAPLALCDGSTIYYTQTDKDWDEEDLQKVEVERLSLTATAISDFPCSLKVTATLLDKNGNELAKRDTDANWAVVPANANEQTGQFSFVLEPADPNVPFRNIDGITFTAIATQSVDGVALAPNQNITIDNVRIKVTGSYTTDF